MTWEERIQRAEASRGFTPDDIKAASLWRSCSVGEATGLFAPTDRGLDDLGRNFFLQIRANDVDGARQTHEAIRERVKELRGDTHGL